MDSANTSSSESTSSPAKPRARPWSFDTRRWVIIGLVIAGALVLYAIRETLPALILALLVAYLINPLVSFLKTRLRLSRLLATAIVYLLLLTVILVVPALFAPTALRQVRALNLDLANLLAQLSASLKQFPFVNSLGLDVEPGALAEQLRGELSSLAEQLPRFAIGALSSVLNVILVLVLSFYLVKDTEAIEKWIDGIVPEDYRDEAQRIKQELGDIWSNFLRGQILLGIIIGVVTGLALTALGVRNALVLGIIAGILEVVPTLGPILSAIPSVLIAFFQGSTLWQIDNGLFAFIVVGTYLLIQQLENHLVVPNVLGKSVNLPPVVILAGALAGASLAGVLGVFLAAPVLATTRLFGQFVLRKLVEPSENAHPKQNPPS